MAQIRLPAKIFYAMIYRMFRMTERGIFDG